MSNPKNGLEAFDAIHFSLLQVLIVASANGVSCRDNGVDENTDAPQWTPVMYTMIDSEFFVSCFFFIVGIVVLNFWLINLFVAVITNTFAAIRSETRKSAFGAAAYVSPCSLIIFLTTPRLVPLDKDQDEGWAVVDGRKAISRPNLAKTIHDYTRWLWVLLALVSLALQASRRATVTPSHELVMFYGEIGITIAFDFEIGLRVLATLPDWRSFFQHANNWLDSILAIGSTIIQIPFIRQSSVYPWFTIFQLARFYRVILVVPRMKPLLVWCFTIA